MGGHQPPSSTRKEVELSEVQQRWLQDHSAIRVGITPEWGPFSYFTPDGKGAGVDVDVLNLISQRTGLKFGILPASPWEKMLRMAETGELDMTTSTVATQERERIFLFTRPYANSSTIIVAREGDRRFRHLQQLRNARVIQPEKHLVTVALQERLPGPLREISRDTRGLLRTGSSGQSRCNGRRSVHGSPVSG